MMRPILLLLVLLMWIVPLHAQDDLSPYDIALQRIEANQINGVEYFDIGGLGLTELPPEIGQLTHLKILGLASNQLTELPPEIGQLAHLQVLFLWHNQLLELPAQIGQLDNLIQLELRDNQLSALPAEIGHLDNLAWLDVRENQLTAFPPEIGQLDSLWVLLASENHLSLLPSQIGQMTNLHALYISDNQLNTIPSEIGQLTNLCYLNIENNQIRYLPSSLIYARQLFGTDCLTYLDMPLVLSSTPPEWTPANEILLEGNPLISPPPEVVEQGTEAILAYLRNQAWYHMQRWIIGIAAGVGLLALFMLGFRFKQRGSRKMKSKPNPHP